LGGKWEERELGALILLGGYFEESNLTLLELGIE
jgi:hypothetical protein